MAERPVVTKETVPVERAAGLLVPLRRARRVRTPVTGSGQKTAATDPGDPAHANGAMGGIGTPVTAGRVGHHGFA